jgi:hypothetical protein
MKRSIFLFAILFFGVSAQAQTLRFFEFGFRTLPDSVNVIAATSDTTVITKALAQLALPESERNLFINGELQYGTETNNPLYSWHFVSNAWDMVEVAVEVCDGQPSDVENDKPYWIDLIGRFCPWSSYLKREIIPSEVRDESNKKLRLFPNPVTDLLTIETDPSIDIREVYVVDALGKTILTLPAQQRTIDLTSLHQGLYYIVVRHNNGNTLYKIAKD